MKNVFVSLAFEQQGGEITPAEKLDFFCVYGGLSFFCSGPQTSNEFKIQGLFAFIIAGIIRRFQWCNLVIDLYAFIN